MKCTGVLLNLKKTFQCSEHSPRHTQNKTEHVVFLLQWYLYSSQLCLKKLVFKWSFEIMFSYWICEITKTTRWNYFPTKPTETLSYFNMWMDSGWVESQYKWLVKSFIKYCISNSLYGTDMWNSKLNHVNSEKKIVVMIKKQVDLLSDFCMLFITSMQHLYYYANRFVFFV